MSCRNAFLESSREDQSSLGHMGTLPDSHLGQSTISVTEELPKSVDVRCAGHIDGHSNNSDRFQDREGEFGDGDITKGNIQTSGGDLSLEEIGQAISRSYVEEFYRPPEALQPFDSRRGEPIPIGDLRKDHIHDFFDKWNTGDGGSSVESGDNRHLETVPCRKFDISGTDIGKHPVFCSFVNRFDVIESIDMSGKR